MNNYPEGNKKGQLQIPKNKIEYGWQYQKVHKQICRDNLSHPLYIRTLAFWVAMGCIQEESDNQYMDFSHMRKVQKIKA